MGVKIKKNRHGKLAFRLFWEKLPGGRSWEGTGLADTPGNRELLDAKAKVIAAEMKEGTFSYLRWFPHGNKAAHFESLGSRQKPATIGDYYDSWILNKVPPIVRRSLQRSYTQHFTAYILPKFGDNPFTAIGKDELEAFRRYLSTDLDLSLKTVKNIVNGSFRAFFRDAIASNVAEINPCEQLDWVNEPKQKPDPMEVWERDKYLAWARGRLPFKHFVFIASQFLTGMRPSEATALRLGKIDLARGRASITTSRDLGHEAGTKTASSDREIWLMPEVITMWRQIWPLRAGEDDYLFTNKDGNPINANNWSEDYWRKGVRACGIRPRKMYSTRHTFISMALSGLFGLAWINVKRVEEQTGDSIVTLQKNYAKYLEQGSATLSATLDDSSPQGGEFIRKVLASPTGFEPVSGHFARSSKNHSTSENYSGKPASSPTGDKRIKRPKTGTSEV